VFTNQLFFAYFSPETLLPVGSILATIAGIGMMLGRGSARLLSRYVRRYLRPSRWIAGVSRPHFRFRTGSDDDRGSQTESASQASEPTLPE
jgi:hypothetical protein